MGTKKPLHFRYFIKRIQEKSSMRIERDVLSAAGSGIDNATNAILCHGNLCKPTAQIGTSWITPQTPGVAIIFWVSIIHLILALLPTVVSCCKSCFCGASEEEAQASAAKFDTSNKLTGGCNSFTTIVLAILGIVCVKVDCKEMLMACVIMAFIALIIAAIQVAIAIWGVV